MEIEKASFKCEICLKEFSKRGYLNMHLKACNGDMYGHKNEGKHKKEKQKCEICDKTYFSLSKHLKQVHTEKEKKSFQCEECPTKFTLISSWKNHLEKHAHNDLTCELCDKTFVSTERLNLHKKRVHSGENIKCELCEMTFSSKSVLNIHKKIHYQEISSPTEKQYKCESCKKSFKLKKNLSIHMAAHLGKFKCEMCDKNYGTKEYLVKHMLRHSNENPFKCRVCYQSFNSRKGREDHEKSHHVAERLLKCDTCGKCYLTRIQLEQHFENVHKNVQLAMYAENPSLAII